MPITLTSAITVAEGGSTVETDASMACQVILVDFFGQQATITYKAGTLSGSGASEILIPGALSPNTIIVTFNLVTGAWVSSTGLSGTLTGASYTSMLTNLASIRNGLESFATSVGVIAGTQVAWAG